MAHQEGVNIEKLQGGLGRLATGTDNHFAMLLLGLPVGAVATAVNNSGKGVAVTSLFAAEALGLNESFDANNSITAHKDISEFFRLAPEATLYLFDKVTATDLKAFINHNKEIKGYGFHMAYDDETPNLVTTINAHQTIINDLAVLNRLIDFCIIGSDDLDVFTQDLFALTAPSISIVSICQANDGVTAVGSALGMEAVRKVNENLGSVNIQRKPLAKRGLPDYPLTDALLGLWPTAYLSDGTDINVLAQATFNDIISKGYILAVPYEGYPGIFFENSYTCVARESDFAFIENNRTWNKAARIIRTTLLPEVKGVVKKDPSSGFIAPTTLGRWKGLLNKSLEQMVKDDEISGFDTYINPSQVVNNTQPVTVKATIVADGIVHKFEVAVGLTNTI